MRKIYWHVGRHKTGTTSLQKFLTLNQDVLLSRGYCYPSNPKLRAGPGDFGHNGFARSFSPEMAELVLEEFSRSKAKNLIISGEGFWRWLSKEMIKLFLDNDFEIIIVAFIRRQDTLMRSAYAWRVTNNGIRYTDSLESIVPKLKLKYLKKLKRLEKVVGKDNFVVRLYDVHPDTTTEFIKVLALDDCTNFKPTPKVNVSLSAPAVQFMTAVNSVPATWQERAKVIAILRRELSKDFIGAKRANAALAPKECYQSVIDLFQDENYEVAQRYLSEEEKGIFIDKKIMAGSFDEGLLELTPEDTTRVESALTRELQSTNAELTSKLVKLLAG